MMIQHILPPQKPPLPKPHIHHTSDIVDAALAAHSMVFRQAEFVRRLGLFFFCSLRTKIEGNHRCKYGQKILAAQASPQSQHTKHRCHRQGYQTFYGQEFIQSTFHTFPPPTVQYAPGPQFCD